MVMLWSALATKDARLAAQSLRRMRPIPADDVLGDLRALPRRHRLGGQRRGRPAGRLRPVRPPRLPQRLLLRRVPGVLRPRRAVPGATRAPATPASPAPPRRCAASATALDARRRARARAGHPPAGAAARGRLRLGRRAAALHGRRAGAGQRRELPATTRRWPADNRWMHRPVLRRRRRRPPARPGHRSRAGCSAGSARWPRPAPGCPRCTRPGEPRCWTSAPRTCSAWRRRHPRSGWFVGLANFAEHPVSVEARVLDGLGELETVLSSDGPLQVQNGRLRLPGTRLRLARRGLANSSPRSICPIRTRTVRSHRRGPGRATWPSPPHHHKRRVRDPTKRPLYTQLWVWVLIGIVAGILVGLLAPGFAKSLKILADLFIQLIKVVIGPVIFCTVIVGHRLAGQPGPCGRPGAAGARPTSWSPT